MSRPRLLARLAGAERKRLVLVVADSGYGKTTLLAQWGATLPTHIAQVWYGARSTDAVARTFTRRLAALLAEFVALERPARSLEEVLDGLEREVVLVLDDVHHLGPQGLTVIRTLLEHPRLHLVLASRDAVDLPLARLRIQGQIVELTAADLAFTRDEILALGISGDPDALLRQTQGWPAAFVLLRLGAEAHPSATRRDLFTLLAEEVWPRLAPDERLVLQAAAVAGSVTVDLVGHLLGRDAGGAVLEAFTQRGWLSRSAEDRYQMHNLFREFVLTRLPERDRTALAGRALQWWVERGEAEEAGAVSPLCSIEVRRRFLVSHGALIARAGGAAALRNALEQLPYDPGEPAEIITLRGRLDNLEGRFDEALRWLDLAQTRAAQTRNWRMLARSSAYEAEIHGHRGAFADAALALRSALTTIGNRDPAGRAELEGFLAYELFQLGQIQEAFEMIERARAWFAEHDSRQQESILIRRRGAMHSMRGELAEAVRWEQRALLRFRQMREPLGEANVAMNMGQTLLWAGRFTEARVELETALAIARRHGLMGMVEQILLARAEVEVEVNGTIPDIPETHESERDLFLWRLLAARAARRQGELHRAWQELGAARPLLAPLSPTYRLRLEVEEGALHLVERNVARALRLLEPAVEALWDGPLRVESYLPRLHRAYARLLDGRPEDVKADLTMLLSWRSEADLGALWGRETWAAVPVLEFARREGIERGYAASLLERFGSPAAKDAKPKIRVGILGPLRVEREGTPIDEDAFGRPQVRQLLGYLALHHPRAVPATELVEALWPQAKTIEESSLYTTVSRLRRVLGRETVVKDGTGYRLGPGVAVDAEAFTRALSIRPPRWADLSALYRGDLLADLPLAEWCFLARDTFRNRFIDAAVGAGEAALAQRDHTSARQAFERALEIDPTCEPALQGLMRLLVVTGDPARALRLFQRFSETLQRELGLAPSEETLRLARRLAG
ncbi:MAG: BTAD domain-containing putative transcriptional regulator [Armatimonadota bacterium]|nr:BTAD domain-containing putative transcriptional regulator [Armatimonadota bacterium]MDR7451395.1 BTAD domain-containing putative transcriptional regulator [Armatimonadota bacterium]MDR7466455.1 BTAD domain-containing putative transcriptional regulator [Armatimonadota bacterium]MDR7493177.1 BTAD domain-containing putative transcriptional regulator [Armatimonadota bacterium]MDR7499470.1 BTAD domain-containing putative transcriptional regulator [Armatimonadota bacterium]